MNFKTLEEKIKADRCLSIVEEVGLILLSFLLPFLLMLFVFISEKIYPFGDNALLMIDMQSQYIAYIRYYKAVLTGDQSMIYTLGKVFGGDFMSIFTYYLASPFNLLVVFFSYNEIPAFFLWTNLLKMSFAGLNMYLLIRFSLNKKHFGNLLFAVGYGLISYSVVYLSNYMWLDGVMILPLVILGMDLLFKKKKYWIYTLALAYSLISSWYIGAMICMFAVFYFIYKYFSCEETFKKRLAYIWRFIFFSLVGGFLAAFCWFTAFSHLAGTKATASFPSPMNYSIKMIIAGFLENNYASTDYICQNYGYMSMFTSVITLVLFQMFFFNKQYSGKERIAAFTLFGFYIACSTFSITYALLHGGREPTWFPGRYSFILGFMICYFGAKQFNALSKSPVYSSIIPLVTGVICLVLLKIGTYDVTWSKKGTYDISSISLLLYFITVIIIMAYLVAIDLKPKCKNIAKLCASLLIVPLTCVSSYRGAKYTLNSSVRILQDISKYQEDNIYNSDILNVKSLEKTNAYRMEVTFNRPGNHNDIDNNPMFYGYNGLSHYSSSENKQIEDYMIKLGFHYNGFFEKYDSGSTASINSFLNIKYLIDNSIDKSSNKPMFISKYPYSKIESLSSENENIEYYVNTLALPFGFASDVMPYEWFKDNEKIGDSMKYYDHFEYQNSIYESLCNSITDDDGNSKNIFTRIPTTETKLSSGVEVDVDEAGHKYYTGKKGSTIRIKYEVPSTAYDSNLYFCEMNINSKLTYMLDYRTLDINTYWHKGIKGVNDNSNHIHELVMTFNEDFNHEIINEGLYYEDTNILKEYVEEIKLQGANDLESTGSLTSFGYKGTFNLLKDNQQMFFTIPYEDGINVYIDGKKVRTFKSGHIFTGADLSNVSKGQHNIRIEYEDSGFKKSIGISLIGLMLTVSGTLFFDKCEISLIEFIDKRKEKKQWKKTKANLK